MVCILWSKKLIWLMENLTCVPLSYAEFTVTYKVFGTWMGIWIITFLNPPPPFLFDYQILDTLLYSFTYDLSVDLYMFVSCFFIREQDSCRRMLGLWWRHTLDLPPVHTMLSQLPAFNFIPKLDQNYAVVLSAFLCNDNLFLLILTFCMI